MKRSNAPPLSLLHIPSIIFLFGAAHIIPSYNLLRYVLLHILKSATEVFALFNLSGNCTSSFNPHPDTNAVAPDFVHVTPDAGRLIG